MTNEELDFAANRLFDILDKKMRELGNITVHEKENLTIEINIPSQPFDVHLKAQIYKNEGMLCLYSVMPYQVPEKKKTKFAEFICKFNYDNMFYGTYDYSAEKSKVVYRISMVFADNLLSEAGIEKELQIAVGTVKQFNSQIYDEVK